MPNLGNRDRLSFNRVLRETRGGTLVVYADPIWPKVQRLVLNFSSLHRSEAQTLLDFFANHLGQEIGLLDWEHRYWQGTIMTPDSPVIEDSFDRFSASFEFEGELSSTLPQVIPTISATPALQLTNRLYGVPTAPPLYDLPTAPAASTLQAGQPVYLTSTGGLGPALAGPRTAEVFGIAVAGTQAGGSAPYVTGGELALSDWTAVTGSVSLVPGASYYLHPSAAGMLTTTAPSVAGQYVIRVGQAVSTTTMNVTIESSVLL